jgi:tetratricopeptide (TPR) repeat protein
MVDANATKITQDTADENSSRTDSATGQKREGEGGPRFGNRFVILAALVVVSAGAWPAYRWWHTYRTEQFKSACKDALADKEWRYAEAIATRWFEWDSGNDDAWVLLASASVELGDVERAAKCLGNVDDSYHGALQALAVRGDLLFSDLNRVDEAVATWKRMLAINPEADLARQRLIYYYAMSLQRDKMLDHIRIAMKLRCEPPEAYAYYLLAYEVNFSDGLTLINKWRQDDPDDEVLKVAHAIYVAKYAEIDTVAGLGSSSVAPGDLSLINQCLTEYPANLEVLAFHLDKALYEGDEARVLKLLSQAPPSAEQDARFWRYRGWYLAGQGRHDKAEQALRKALEIHPVDWRPRWLLAGVLRRLGRSSEASETSRVALIGKELRQDLFELPNARALSQDLFSRIRAYLNETAPPFAREAIEFRIDTDPPPS